MSIAQQPNKLSDETLPLPRLRDSITLRQLTDTMYAVKDSKKRSYFHVGPEEAFLLNRLRRVTTWVEIRDAYKNEFDEVLDINDFRDFLKLAKQNRFVVSPGEESKTEKQLDDEAKREGPLPQSNHDDDDISPSRGSVLFFRIPLFDPDRHLTWFARTFPFIWTRGFLLLSTALMFFALGVLLTHQRELVVSFRSAIRWETAYLGIVAIVLVTAVHELGHGATCKKFGGEVHESGLLFMFFMPCMYVNVSDAWFIPERWKRLLITFAGGYADLCMWAVAVLVWRAVQMGTLVHHLAFVVLTTCGTRALMNFNPLLRMDGYYLLSDFMKFPNLYGQSRSYWLGTLNWLLWGASKPPKAKMRWFIFFYGMVCWIFAIIFLNVVGLKLIGLAGNEFGLAGLIFTSALFLYGMRRVFRGFLGSEFITMLRKRILRTAIWLGGIGALIALAFIVPVKYYAVGDFEVRPYHREEVSSPMNSFIARVCVQDGNPVKEGDVLVELHAPELASLISAKDSELHQSQANLAKLEAGPRPEEIHELSEKTKRLKSWFELGEQELATAKSSLDFQLKALQERGEQVRLQIKFAKEVLKKSEELNRKGAVAGVQLNQERSQLEILRSQETELQSQYDSRAAEGVRIATAELARRQQELADAEAQLKLLKLGSRREEIDAEKARCDRLIQELDYLKQQRERLVIKSPAAGTVSAPRLGEKVGQFAPQGSLICHIEDAGAPHVEIFVSEDDAALVRPGQSVQLKARSLPFETFTGIVERVAPAAAKPQEAVASQQAFVRQAVVVHCSVEGATNKLKSGMTGFGRVYRGKNNIGTIMASKAYRYVRTEFWW